MVTTAVACGLPLIVAAPVYGLPAAHDGRVESALSLGAVGFVSLGVLCGSLLPSVRSAQAVGLLMFFPSFLLGAGGPPPRPGLGIAARRRTAAADVADQCRAWAMAGPGFGHRSLVAVATLAVAVTIVAVRRTALWRGRVPPGTANGDGPVVASKT